MFVIFEVGGRQYRLRFTANAVCEVESMAGCGLSRLMEKGEVLGVRLLLWAGLLHEGGITLEQAGAIMDECIEQSGSLKELCDTVKEALEGAGFIPIDEADMESDCRMMALALGGCILPKNRGERHD